MDNRKRKREVSQSVGLVSRYLFDWLIIQWSCRDGMQICSTAPKDEIYDERDRNLSDRHPCSFFSPASNEHCQHALQESPIRLRTVGVLLWDALSITERNFNINSPERRIIWKNGVEIRTTLWLQQEEIIESNTHTHTKRKSNHSHRAKRKKNTRI